MLTSKFTSESGKNKRFLAFALKETNNEKAIPLFAEAVSYMVDNGIKVGKDKKEETRPLVTVSDLQRLQQYETISLRLRKMPFKTKWLSIASVNGILLTDNININPMRNNMYGGRITE